MAKTLEHIISTIHNNLSDGLKGVSNFTYALEQLASDIIAERDKIASELSTAGKFVKHGFLQDINCIEVDDKHLSKCPSALQSKEGMLKHFEIPVLSVASGEVVVDYIGPVKRDEAAWKIYINDSRLYHEYKLAIRKKPFVYINTSINENNMYDCFVGNYDKVLKTVSLTAILEDPRDIEDYKCVNPEWKFPSPDFVINDIVKRLTEKYIRYYRQLNVTIQPNTQTEINS